MVTRRFSAFHGRRMRVTRVDACGRPIYGVGAQVVTSGFVSVEMTGEVREGDDIEQVNAAGELCLSEKGADQLKWLNITGNFCEVDPDLVTLFNPLTQRLFDYAGNVVGFAESDRQDITQGVALEIWADVAGDDLCDDPDASVSYAYFLVPFVVGGTLGDLTIENAGLTTVINSRSKRGSKWGAGPYDVMLNPPANAPVPGPMLAPVGTREHRRVFLTTIAPPESVPGAQPLSNPDGPAFEAIEGATPLTTDVETSETGMVVNWGDGSAPAPLTADTALPHAYTAAGTYHVAVYQATNPNVVTVQTVEVPWP